MTDGPTGRRDFFVSFNKADRALATWIAWVLEEAGYSVFFQDWDFKGNFVEHMNRAHTQAHRTLAVLSDHYFGSDFTLSEWSARLFQDPAAREDRLVPVKVGPLSGETILGPLVYADLTGCGEEEAQKRLLGRVRKAVDADYRDKPQTRPGFPGGPPREVPSRPEFPPAGIEPVADRGPEERAMAGDRSAKPEPEYKPPPQPPKILLRQKEIDHVVKNLCLDNPPPTVILGRAGIGKSVVSLAALHQEDVVQKYRNRRFFVQLGNLQAPRDTIAEEMVAEIAREMILPLGKNPLARVVSKLHESETALVLDSIEVAWSLRGLQWFHIRKVRCY